MDTQQKTFPDQKIDCKKFLEEETKDSMTPEILQLLVDYQFKAFPDE